MSELIIPKEIPEWLANLPPKAKVNAKDFAKALGFSRPHTIHGKSYIGDLPKPDSVMCVGLNGFNDPNHKRVFWYAATVRNEIRRRMRKALQ